MQSTLCVIHCDQDTHGCEKLRGILSLLTGRENLRFLTFSEKASDEQTLARMVQELSRHEHVVPLLSADFLQLPALQHEEMILALRRFAFPWPRIYPVQLSPCLWFSHPVFRSLSPLPWDDNFCRVPVNDASWTSPAQAWARVADGLKERLRPTTCAHFEMPETVYVPGGEFLLASRTFTEKKVYRISAFHFGKYPITVGQFAQFIRSTGYRTTADLLDCSFTIFENRIHPDRGVNWRCNTRSFAYAADEMNFPVIHVSWKDANAYCKWLSEKTHQRWRLPTEVEWEYAARGGRESPHADTAYPGRASLDDIAWHVGNSEGQTHPVGLKAPNALGIYDLCGNVFEWCEDCYSEDDSEMRHQSDRSDDKLCEKRAVRGGSWRCGPTACHWDYRKSLHQEFRSDDVGFRVMQEIEPT